MINTILKNTLDNIYSNSTFSFINIDNNDLVFLFNIVQNIMKKKITETVTNKFSFFDKFSDVYLPIINKNQNTNIILINNFDPDNKFQKDLFLAIKKSVSKSELPNNIKDHFNTLNLEKFISEKNSYLDFNPSINNTVDGFEGFSFTTVDIINEIKNKIDNNQNSRLIGHEFDLDVGLFGKTFFIGYFPSWIDDYQKNLNKISCMNCSFIAESLLQYNPKIFKKNIDVRNYRINFYNALIDKKFHGNEITPENINSGATIDNHNSYGIRYTSNIYRNEEQYKVAIHEMFHAMNIKANSPQNIYFKIEPNKNLLLEESIVEFLAQITNCIILSTDFNEFKNFITYELKFNFFQISKILKMSGFKNFKDFLQKNNNDTNKNLSLKQKTACAEYFIIKTIIYFYLDDFFKIIRLGNNKDLFNCLDIFLKDFINNNNYIDKIDEIVLLNMKFLDEKDNFLIDDYSRITARMTCCEPKFIIK